MFEPPWWIKAKRKHMRRYKGLSFADLRSIFSPATSFLENDQTVIKVYR
jgi:hypothetical protein